jgi:hypothetical protein
MHAQLKLIDFGKMLCLKPDESGVHCLINSVDHGTRGYEVAPELNQRANTGRAKVCNGYNGRVDGRRTDMFRAGDILKNLCLKEEHARRCNGCDLCSLVKLLMGPAPQRPLASELLSPQPNPNEAMQQALRWVQGEVATDLELVDELESRRPSEDGMAERYCHKLFIHDEEFDVATLPMTLRESLTDAGFRSTATENSVTSSKELAAGEKICGRITVEERRLYRGEALRPFFKQHNIDASLCPPIDGLERIPDGEHPENSVFVRHAQNLARRPSRPHLQNELGRQGRSRRLVQLTVRYISGTNNRTFFHLLSIVNKTISDLGLGISVAMERKTAAQKAYAALRWLRMILLSGYAYHQFRIDDAFDTNFVPLVIMKLGQLLAALSALEDQPMPDESQLESIRRFKHTLMEDTTSDRQTASESENSMQLTEDMVRQLG